MDVIGADALTWLPERPLYETLQLPPDEEELLAVAPRYLNSRTFTIMGGTSEIQTNILAKSLVGCRRQRSGHPFGPRRAHNRRCGG